MNYFGLFFSFMLPGIVIGIMIAVAFVQERAAHKRRTAAVRGGSPATVRSYTATHKKSVRASAPATTAKSNGAKLYIYDMNAA